MTITTVFLSLSLLLSEPKPDQLPSPLKRPTPLRTTAHAPLKAQAQRQQRGKVTLSNTRGIDVSHYQGQINWQAARADDHVQYCYIKATENASLVDNMYYQNVRQARAAGVLVGTYHFFSPTASAAAQLLNLTRTMPTLRDQDLVPMIDVEARGKCSIEEFRTRLHYMLKGVEQHYGVRPIIYTGQNFYNKYLVGHFDDYVYMIAKYGDEPPTLDGMPKFAIWQYSQHGRVAGIRGDVDLSRFVNGYELRDILIQR